MENDEMTNDAAVAWAVPGAFDPTTRRHSWVDVWTHRREPYTEPLYSATTVAELRAEVERLRVQLAGCGVIALSNTRDSLAEQMPPTSAYGWSPSLVEVHDAVFREIQNRERADAAERRVAELEAGARELRRAFIFRQAVVASAETPEKLDFADDKVWAAAEKVRELLEKSP